MIKPRVAPYKKCRGARWQERFTWRSENGELFSVAFWKLSRCPTWRHFPAVSSKRSVQRQRKHGWQKLFEFEEQPASVRGLNAVTITYFREKKKNIFWGEWGYPGVGWSLTGAGGCEARSDEFDDQSDRSTNIHWTAKTSPTRLLRQLHSSSSSSSAGGGDDKWHGGDSDDIEDAADDENGDCLASSTAPHRLSPLRRPLQRFPPKTSKASTCVKTLLTAPPTETVSTRYSNATSPCRRTEHKTTPPCWRYILVCEKRRVKMQNNVGHTDLLMIFRVADVCLLLADVIHVCVYHKCQTPSKTNGERD